MRGDHVELPTGAVTFLFTDIEGSTPLWDRHPGTMRQALVTHDAILEEAITGGGGTVFKKGGDSFCAAFTDPHAALAAATSAQRTLADFPWPDATPIRVRMGLHTGTAHLREGDYFGPTLNRAARLMDAGHGQQILISSTTHRLVMEETPPDLSIERLGTHYLKGLDRPEEIFQVTPDGLDRDFPPLRTITGGEDQRAGAAIAAFQEKKWREAHDLLLEMESRGPLSGEQHALLAETLWWLGDHEPIGARFEAAHRAYLAEGDLEGAAVAAVEVAEVRHHELSPSVSRSWERKADKLLEGLEDSTAMGHLLRWKTVRTFDIDGDIDAALEYATRVMRIAKEVGDGDLEVLALQDQGRILVAGGRVEEGMALIDEAMVAAVAGDVSPIVVGRSYCNMLAACDRTGDLGRAAEWSQAAEAWCEESRHAPYPGVCRIFKAEVMWHRGQWEAARNEVLRASDELGGLADVIGEAWYQYGEMLVRAGDDAGAEAAFQEALTRGRQPVPGYAILLLRRGLAEEARDLLVQRLDQLGEGRLERVKHLPTLIEIELALGSIEAASMRTDELDAIAQLTGSALFGARAARAHGQVALAAGEPPTATGYLKSAVDAFTRLELPYEAALTHADLAKAMRAEGASALAAMEHRVAVAELERLGAVPDAERIRSDFAGG